MANLRASYLSRESPKAKRARKTTAQARIGGVLWTFEFDPSSETEEKLKRLTRALAAGRTRVTKRGRKKTVLAVALSQGGDPTEAPRYHLKIFRHDGLLRRLAATLGRSKGRREWDIAREIEARGIPASVPLALGERRRLGLVVESMLLIELYEDCIDLEVYLLRSNARLFEKFEILGRLGGLVRRAHDHGFDQDDLAANNFLLRRTGASTLELLLTDFERARIVRSVSWKRRWHTIAKLNRVGRPVTAGDRLRFLLRYLSEGEAVRVPPAVKEAVREIDRAAAALRRRDHKRMRSLCLGNSRLFEGLRGRGMRAYFRRGTQIGTVLDALRSFDDHVIKPLSEIWNHTHVERARVRVAGTGEEERRFFVLRLRRARRNWALPFVRRLEPRSIWVAANWLYKLRAPVLRPLALLMRSDEQREHAAYLVLEDVSAAPLLDRWMRSDGNWERGRRALAASLGWLSRHAFIPPELTARDFLAADAPGGVPRLHGVHKLAPRLSRSSAAVEST